MVRSLPCSLACYCIPLTRRSSDHPSINGEIYRTRVAELAKEETTTRKRKKRSGHCLLCIHAPTNDFVMMGPWRIRTRNHP